MKTPNPDVARHRYRRYEGTRYLESERGADGPYRWVDGETGARIDDALQTEISVLALKILSKPGRAGAMSTGAAITDPLFWVIHPLFEKGWHVLRLSPRCGAWYLGERTRRVRRWAPQPRECNGRSAIAPRYAHYDMGWTNGTCHGSRLHDDQAFANVFDDSGHYYTNAELLKLLDPRKVQ